MVTIVIVWVTIAIGVKMDHIVVSQTVYVSQTTLTGVRMLSDHVGADGLPVPPQIDACHVK